MYLLISSHINYHQTTLPVLFQSLKEVDPQKIITVIGGSSSEYTQYNTYGIKEVFVKYNAFDYTALCWKADNISIDDKNNVFFLLHDTCVAGPLFYKKVSNTKQLTMIRPVDSMSMGVYTNEIIKEYKDHLQQYKLYKSDSISIDLHKRLLCEHEDLIFKNKNCQNYFGDLYCEVEHNVDYYQTGNKRRVEYYPQIDLFKIKANYGQNGWSNFINYL
jgi:hypothetical protein